VRGIDFIRECRHVVVVGGGGGTNVNTGWVEERVERGRRHQRRPPSEIPAPDDVSPSPDR